MKSFYKEFVISNDKNILKSQLIGKIKYFPFVIKRSDLLSVFVKNKKDEERLKKILTGFNFKEFLLKKDVVPPQNLQKIRIDGLVFKRSGMVSKNHIIITPGVSFGYDHPATILMIKKLLNLSEFYKGKRILDVGAGTGILSLVMVKKGAKKIIGLDICPFVVKEAMKNVKKNHIKRKKIQILLKDISLLRKKFSFVVANVPINVHELVSTSIKKLLYKDGFLLIGGIVKSNIENIKKIYNDFKILEIDFLEDWSVILLKSNTKAITQLR